MIFDIRRHSAQIVFTCIFIWYKSIWRWQSLGQILRKFPIIVRESDEWCHFYNVRECFKISRLWFSLNRRYSLGIKFSSKYVTELGFADCQLGPANTETLTPVSKLWQFLGDKWDFDQSSVSKSICCRILLNLSNFYIQSVFFVL